MLPEQSTASTSSTSTGADAAGAARPAATPSSTAIAHRNRPVRDRLAAIALAADHHVVRLVLHDGAADARRRIAAEREGERVAKRPRRAARPRQEPLELHGPAARVSRVGVDPQDAKERTGRVDEIRLVDQVLAAIGHRLQPPEPQPRQPPLPPLPPAPPPPPHPPEPPPP